MNISKFKLAAIIILLGFLVAAAFYVAPAVAQTELTLEGTALEAGPADSKAPLSWGSTAEGDILNDKGEVVGRFSVKVTGDDGKVTISIQFKEGIGEPRPGHTYCLDPDKSTISISPSCFTIPQTDLTPTEQNEFYFSVGNVKDLNNANALKDLVLYAKGSGKVVILAKVTDKRDQVFTGQVKAKVAKNKAYNLKLSLPSVRTDGPMAVSLKVDKGKAVFLAKGDIGKYREFLKVEAEAKPLNRVLKFFKDLLTGAKRQESQGEHDYDFSKKELENPDRR